MQLLRHCEKLQLIEVQPGQATPLAHLQKIPDS
jgi:hypothetical protein